MAHWQATLPVFRAKFLGSHEYYWVIWDYSNRTPILVEVYLDDEVGYRVRTDGKNYSPDPQDFLLWWSEPVNMPPAPLFDQKEMEAILYPDFRGPRTANPDRLRIQALVQHDP